MSQSNKVANSESNTVVRTVADTAETAKEVVTDAARLTKDTLSMVPMILYNFWAYQLISIHQPSWQLTFRGVWYWHC